MTSSQSSVEQLLLCLSSDGPRSAFGGQPTADGREPLAVSRQPSLDWGEVVDLAVRHDLAPLLFKRLKESGARTRVPADAWERLRLAYFSSAERNTRLFRELRNVLGCLRDAGIPVIVLKGAFLAEAVYGDVALRPMCDADLMVSRTELPRAQTVLLRMGGGQVQPKGNELFWREHLHPPPTVLRGLPIELHWTITDSTGPAAIDPAHLWDRAHPATIAGVQVLALAPEDLLLHLCLHLCLNHHLIGLRSLCDIAETIRHYRGAMDWEQVVRPAREWGAVRYVGLTLQLARRMLGAGVPDEVLERLVPGGIDEQVLEAARQSALAQTGYQWTPIFGMMGAKSFGDKVKLVWERVFLPRDEMARVYPASRDSRHLYLYYLMRLRDAVCLHGASVLRLVRSPGYRQETSKNASVANWLRTGQRQR